MQENGKKVGNAAFYLALFLILFVDYVSATSVTVVYSGRMFQLAVILLFGKVLITQYTKKEWALLGILLVVGAVSFFCVRNYFAILLFLLIFASKDISPKKIIAVYLTAVGLCILITVVAACFGWFGEMSMTQDFRGKGVVETRYCFGFSHPNTFHIVVLQFILVLLWQFWERVRWFYIVIAVLGNLLLYSVTLSRTNLILGTGILGCMILGKVKAKLQQTGWIYGMGIAAFGASLLLSLLTVLIGTKSAVLSFIDKVWSGRIFLGNLWANNYRYYTSAEGLIMTEREKITLFSHEGGQVFVDMGFIKLYYNYGVIIFAIVIILIGMKLYQNARKQDFAELLILIAGIVWMLGEAFYFGEFITRNFLFVSMFGLQQCLLLSCKKRAESEEE